MHELDLNLLPVLRVVLEESSVARAAERLHLSPSATSRALDRARRALDDPLLVPSGRGLTPTARARELLPRLAGALDDLDAVVGRPDSFDPHRIRRTMAIRTNEVFVAALAAPLAGAIRRQAPGLRLRFESEGATDIDDIRAGTVALASAPTPTSPPISHAPISSTNRSSASSGATIPMPSPHRHRRSSPPSTTSSPRAADAPATPSTANSPSTGSTGPSTGSPPTPCRCRSRSPASGRSGTRATAPTRLTGGSATWSTTLRDRCASRAEPGPT